MLTSNKNVDAMIGISESTLLTPRRAQKRLFNSVTSSTKRNLFRDIRTSNNPNEPNSGDDSDIGPMSPLALSDTATNSATNSPRRKFDSPLASAENGSSVSLRSVDINLWEMDKRNDSQYGTKVGLSSPFSALKMLTKIARHSQRRLGCQAFSELSITANENDSAEENAVDEPPRTPEPTSESLIWNESITETPKRVFGKEIQNNTEFESNIIAESPQKDSPVKMLITPLGSVSKEAPLPRLHHRKSLANTALYGSSSPTDTKENGLKRTACPLSAPESLKLSKLDSCPSIPKARAALFQERKEEFKLSTKLFYHSPPPADILRTRKSPPIIEKVELRRGLKRPGVRTSRINRGRTTKRRRYGEINAGIGHCVKKPKLKKPLPHMTNEATKKEKMETVSSVLVPPHRETKSIDESSNQGTVKPLSDDSKLKFYQTERAEAFQKEYEPPVASAEVDPGKKFFKTNRTLTRNIPATVTVNNTIKLQVSNGKLKLQSNEAAGGYTNPRKKPRRGLDFVLDANDLTVDDPKFEASAVDGTSIENILRVLEEDWAEDEYDTLEALVPNARPVLSPKSQNLPSDVTMSPASELSSMTSIMNIKDAGDFFTKVEQMPYNSENVDKNEQNKFYPLFNKDFKNQSKVNM